MTWLNATDRDAAEFTAVAAAAVAAGVGVLSVGVFVAAAVVGVGMVGELVGVAVPLGEFEGEALLAKAPPLPARLPQETSRTSASAALDAERQAFGEHLG